MKSNQEKLVIALTPEESMRLLRVALDDDREEALVLVRDCLYPRLVKEMEKTHCRPAFEMDARKRDGAREENPWLDKKKS